MFVHVVYHSVHENNCKMFNGELALQFAYDACRMEMTTACFQGELEI